MSAIRAEYTTRVAEFPSTVRPGDWSLALSSGPTVHFTDAELPPEYVFDNVGPGTHAVYFTRHTEQGGVLEQVASAITVPEGGTVSIRVPLSLSLFLA